MSSRTYYPKGADLGTIPSATDPEGGPIYAKSGFSASPVSIDRFGPSPATRLRSNCRGRSTVPRLLLPDLRKREGGLRGVCCVSEADIQPAAVTCQLESFQHGHP